MRFMMQLFGPFNSGISIDLVDEYKADAFVRMLNSPQKLALSGTDIGGGMNILICNNYVRSPYTMQHRATVINNTEV